MPTYRIVGEPPASVEIQNGLMLYAGVPGREEATVESSARTSALLGAGLIVVVDPDAEPPPDDPVFDPIYADRESGQTFRNEGGGVLEAIDLGGGGSGVILPWAPDTVYLAGQPVTSDGNTFTAVDAHTSGEAFADDLEDHWQPLPVGSGSGLPDNVLTKTANFTAAAGDLILANATAGGFTVTLPSDPADGALVTVKKTDGTGNAVAVDAAGSGTIDGDAGGASITSPQFGAIFEHVGADVWVIVAPTSSGGSNGTDGADGAAGADGADGAISVIENEGTPLTVRSNVNFVGSAVSAADAGGKTVVTVTAPAAVPVLGITPAEATGTIAVTADYVFGIRVQVPQSGDLRDLSLIVNTPSGNVKVGVYDTGQATATVRTKLYDSGSIAVPAGTNQTKIIADPNLAVVAGQEIDLVMIADNGTIVMIGHSIFAAVALLPTGFRGTGVLPKLAWNHAAGSFTLPATIAEAAVTVAAGRMGIFARIT